MATRVCVAASLLLAIISLSVMLSSCFASSLQYTFTEHAIRAKSVELSNFFERSMGLYGSALAGRVIKICGKELGPLLGIEPWRMHVYAYTECGFVELPILAFDRISYVPIAIKSRNIINVTLFGVPITMGKESCLLIKLPWCQPLYVKPSKLVNLLLQRIPRSEIRKLYVVNVSIDTSRDIIVKNVIKEYIKTLPQPEPIRVLVNVQGMNPRYIPKPKLNTSKIVFDAIIAVTSFSNLYELNSFFISPTMLQPFELWGLTPSELSSIESSTKPSNLVDAIRAFVYTPVSVSVSIKTLNTSISASNRNVGTISNYRVIDLAVPPTSKRWEGENEVVIPLVLKPRDEKLSGYTTLGIYLDILVHRKTEEQLPSSYTISTLLSHATTITSPISSTTFTYTTIPSATTATTTATTVSSTTRETTTTHRTSTSTTSSTTTTTPGIEPGICLKPTPPKGCRYYVMSLAKELAKAISEGTTSSECVLRVDATLELSNGTELLEAVRYYAIPQEAPSLIIDHFSLPANELLKLFSSTDQGVRVVYRIDAICPANLVIDVVKAIKQYAVLEKNVENFIKRIEKSKAIIDAHAPKSIFIPSGIKRAYVLANLASLSSVPIIEDVSGYTKFVLTVVLKSLLSKPIKVRFCVFKCVERTIKPYEVNIPLELSIDVPMSMIVSSLASNQIPVIIEITKGNPWDSVNLYLRLQGTAKLESMIATYADTYIGNDRYNDVALGVHEGVLREPILVAYSFSLPITHYVNLSKGIEVYGPAPATVYLWTSTAYPFTNWLVDNNVRVTMTYSMVAGERIKKVIMELNVSGLELEYEFSGVIAHMANEKELRNVSSFLGTLSSILNVVSFILSFGNKVSILSIPLNVVSFIVDLAYRGTIGSKSIECSSVKTIDTINVHGHVVHVEMCKCVARIIPPLYGVLSSVGVIVSEAYLPVHAYDLNVSLGVTLGIAMTCSKITKVNLPLMRAEVLTYRDSDLKSAGISYFGYFR